MRLYKLPRKLCTTDCRLSFPRARNFFGGKRKNCQNCYSRRRRRRRTVFLQQVSEAYVLLDDTRLSSAERERDSTPEYAQVKRFTPAPRSMQCQADSLQPAAILGKYIHCKICSQCRRSSSSTGTFCIPCTYEYVCACVCGPKADLCLNCK